MNPIIGAALISGGWAAAVAAIGYYYNRVTAKATIQATNANAFAALDAAHEAQLWEKKAESYLDVLAVVLHRGVDWKGLAGGPLPDKDTYEAMLRAVTPPDDKDWVSAATRLTAYASQAVLGAMDASGEADDLVRARLMHWQALIDQATARAPGGPSDDQIWEALRAVRAAAVASVEADRVLQALIRADLALKPSGRARLAQLAADNRRMARLEHGYLPGAGRAKEAQVPPGAPGVCSAPDDTRRRPPSGDGRERTPPSPGMRAPAISPARTPARCTVTAAAQAGPPPRVCPDRRDTPPAHAG